MLVTALSILLKTMAMKVVLEKVFGTLMLSVVIFLTTKLPTSIKDYEGTKKAIDDALDRFSLEYIDMLLIPFTTTLD